MKAGESVRRGRGNCAQLVPWIRTQAYYLSCRRRTAAFLDQPHIDFSSKCLRSGSRHRVRNSFANSKPTSTASDSFGCCTTAVSSPAYISKKTGGVMLIPLRTALRSPVVILTQTRKARQSLVLNELC